MKKFPSVLRRRKGTSLIELILYIAMLTMIGTAVFPMLFTATEDRLLQQTIALVEENGLQSLQIMGARIQHAERVLSPMLAATGSVLALQTASGSTNPTIFGLSGGTLVMAQGASLQNLSSSQVAVTALLFRNTTNAAARPGVEVTITISRSIRLQAPRTYQQTFQGVYTLFPDDVPEPSDCSCALPGCAGGNNFVWNVCLVGECMETQTAMQCP